MELAVTFCNFRLRREALLPAPQGARPRGCPASVSPCQGAGHLSEQRAASQVLDTPRKKKWLQGTGVGTSRALTRPAAATVPTPLGHGDDLDSLLSGWSLLEGFGFSKMNLLRRLVSELVWAPAYASPRDEAQRGLAQGTCWGWRSHRSPAGHREMLTSVAGGLGHVL